MRSYQNIILYKESAENPWNTPSKIANIFLNRFVIDEDLACEIIGTYNLSNNDVDNFGVIHNSLEKAAAYRGYSKNIHFVFARNYLSLGKPIENVIVDWTIRSMKESVIITLLTMKRITLVSKERMMMTIQNQGSKYMCSFTVLFDHRQKMPLSSLLRTIER